MSAEQEPRVCEAQIAVQWREEEYHQALAAFVAQANAADQGIFERFGRSVAARQRRPSGASG